MHECMDVHNLDFWWIVCSNTNNTSKIILDDYSTYFQKFIYYDLIMIKTKNVNVK